VRRDHPIFSLSEVNPGYDLDAKALLVTYCIGDDRDPDEVIDIQANGDFRIDDALREEIRAILLDSTDELSADDLDLDVQEAKIPPQGTGMAYQFEIWLQNPWTIGLATNLIAAGILKGSNTLRQKYRRNAPPATPPTVKPVLSPEENVIRYVQSVTGRHYQSNQTLTVLNFFVTERNSDLELSATVDLSEDDGRTFHVTIDYQGRSWRLTHIVRTYPHEST
jgi:hypothetical protein